MENQVTYETVSNGSSQGSVGTDSIEATLTRDRQSL